MPLRRARSHSALLVRQGERDLVGLGIHLPSPSSTPTPPASLTTHQAHHITPAAAYAQTHSTRARPMSLPDNPFLPQPSRSSTLPTAGLARQGTLLTTSADPRELSLLLGKGQTARLRPRSQTLPRSLSAPYSHAHLMASPVTTDSVALEQARPKTRVALDLRLENDVSVEGGMVRGSVELNLRQAETWIAGAKLRVVGFEEITGPSLRHVFYQHAEAMSVAAPQYRILFDDYSAVDEEGYRLAKAGSFRIPFEISIPVGGGAKGVFKSKQAEVRYIVIVSFKLKYGSKGSTSSSPLRSIAHFFRPLSLYPLVPSFNAVLAALPEPMTAEVERAMLLAGSGKVTLQASIERGIWISGCKIWVTVKVCNGCTKKVKSLSVSLIRTVSSFRPRGRSSSDQPEQDDNYTVIKSSKAISTSLLLSGDKASGRQHASARGWFIGVPPGDTEVLCWSVIVPPEEVSVRRSKLLEVLHTVNVAIDCGGPGGELGVELPVMIVNGVSMDPPPRQKPARTSLCNTRSTLSDRHERLGALKKQARSELESGDVPACSPSPLYELAPSAYDTSGTREAVGLLEGRKALIVGGLHKADLKYERMVIGDLDWHEQARLDIENLDEFEELQNLCRLGKKVAEPSALSNAASSECDTPRTASSYTPSIMHPSNRESFSTPPPCIPASISSTSSLSAVCTSSPVTAGCDRGERASDYEGSESGRASRAISSPRSISLVGKEPGFSSGDKPYKRPLPRIPVALAQTSPKFSSSPPPSSPDILHSIPRSTPDSMSLSPAGIEPDRSTSNPSHRPSLMACSILSGNSVRDKIARLERAAKASQEDPPALLSRSSTTLSQPPLHASQGEFCKEN